MKRLLFFIISVTIVQLSFARVSSSFYYTYMGQTIRYYGIEGSGDISTVYVESKGFVEKQTEKIKGDLILPDIFSCPNLVNLSGLRLRGIYENAFVGQSELNSVFIPSTVLSIGRSAFKDCSGLTSVTMPSSVVSIEDYAFSGCSALTSIEMPSTLETIGNGIFEDCFGLKSVEIFSQMTGKWTFSNCTELKSVSLSTALSSIETGAFNNCSSLQAIEIPSSVESIGDNAFTGCSSLRAIEIPSSVQTIGVGAFKDCVGLSRFNLPSYLSTIEESAFEGCSSLETIKIPSFVKTIKKGAFKNCIGLKTIEIPSSVVSIEDSAFEGCSNLESIIIPSSVKTIGTRAFSGCKALKSITSSVESIGDYAFYECSSLASITIPSVKTIGAHTFDSCSSLMSISLPSSLESIGTSAFYRCSSLRTIVIPSSITSLSGGIFRNCLNLTSVELPSTITSIESSAFQGCSGLTSISIPTCTTSIGKQAFEGCSGLTSIGIPQSVRSIGERAFYDCSNLTELKFMGRVKFEYTTFWRCNLKIIESYNKQPPCVLDNEVFDEFPYQNIVLRVPVGSKKTYMQQQYGKWRQFSNIEEALSIQTITFVNDTIEGFVGYKLPLLENVPPENGQVILSSSDESIASINNSYQEINLNEVGECIITATSADYPDISASFVLKVKPLIAEKIELNHSIWNTIVNEKLQLIASFTPKKTIKQALIWSSSDESVAIVDKNGLVTAIGAGECVITAKTTDGSDIMASCTISSHLVLADKIELNYKEWSGFINERVQLSATLCPKNVADNTLLWSTSDELIVRIDESGLLTAIGIGKTTIKVSCGTVSDSCIVTVKPILATSIILDKKEMDLYPGSKIPLTASINPSTVTDKSLIWTSSDESVVAVDTDGTVTAVGVGVATVTVTSGNVSAECRITVSPLIPVTSIILDRTEIECRPGGSVSLKATVYPDTASNKTLIWSSSNESVATVDSYGRVTAVGVGEATIKVCCGDVSAECVVNVSIPVSSISLNKTRIEIHPRESVSLEASVSPATATDKTLSWSSSDESVATVDSVGRVTAVGVGNAKISVSCGGVTAVCTVVANHVEQFQYTYEGQTLTYKVSDPEKMTCIMCGSYLADDVESVIIPDVAIDKYGNKFDVIDFTGLYGRSSLKSLRMPASLTVISRYRFSDYSNLKSVEFPRNLTKIEYGAFLDCIGLEYVEFPSILSTIEDIAFEGCDNLTSIKLPQSITTIGNSAFGNCSNLLSVDIPSSLTSIGEGVFNFCGNLTSIVSRSAIPPVIHNDMFDHNIYYNDKCVLYVPADSENAYREAEVWKNFTRIETFEVSDSPSVSLSKTKLELFQRETASLMAIVMPEEAENTALIWSSSDESVATVDRDGRVTAVGVGEATITVLCGDLSAECRITVNPPIPVTSITLDRTEIEFHPGESVSLEAVVYPDTATDKTLIWSCSDESVATVDSDGRVTAVGVGNATIKVSCGDVSAECKVTVNIPVASIGLNKTEIEIHPGESASLEAAVYPDTATDKTLIWSSSDESVATVDSDGRVTAMGVGYATISVSCGDVTAACSVVAHHVERFQYTYEGQTLTYKVSDPEKMTCIMDGSYLADDVESVIIPDVAIDEYGNRFEVIDFTGLNDRSGLKSVRLPSTITEIGRDAFLNCADLTSINFPSSLTVIGYRAFWGCSSLASIELPQSLTTIDSDAFRECSSLTSVHLPSSITSMGWCAFTGCSNLTLLEIPSSLASLDASIIAGCNKLTSIIVRSSQPPVADYAFTQFYGYDKCVLYVPAGSENAYSQAAGWKNFTHIETFEVSDSPSVSLSKTKLELYQGETTSLVAIVMPEGAENTTLVWSSSNESVATVDSDGRVTAVGVGEAIIKVSCGDVFAECRITVKKTTVTSITLDRTNVEIRLDESVSLEAAVYPDTATDKTLIWSSSNESVATVDSAGRVTAVGVGNATIKVSCGDVSAECSVIVTRLISEIFQYTYDGQTLTYKVSDPNRMTCIMDGSYLTDDVESVIIPDIAIDEYGNSFDVIDFTGLNERSGLKSVRLPSTITEIGRDAFLNCADLTSINFPSSLTVIGYRAFCGCSSLASIELPQSLTTIEPDAFRRCTSLTSAHLPSSITSMGWCIFAECSSLTLLEIPSSLTSLSGLIIEGCNNLTSIILRSSQPPAVQDDTFNRFNGYDKCVLYVPAGSENAYSQADGWKNFTHIEPIEVLDSPSVSLSKTKLELYQGETTSLVAIVMPEGAENTTLIWSSSDESVATVDSDGRVTAVGVGEAIIKVSYGDISAECRITVKKTTVTSITLDRTNVEIRPDESISLEAAVYPDTATDKTLIWSSSDESVATVDSDGRVTAVGVGNATIKVLCGEVSAKCSVVVTKLVTEIFQYTYEGQTFTYKVRDFEEGTCSFDGTDLTDDVESIVIPEVAIDEYGNSYRVISFKGLNKHKGLKSLRLPSTITAIPSNSFIGCKGLVYVELPSSITKIGDCAFLNCSNLASINLPPSLTVIGYRAFEGCRSLVSIELPQSLTTIESDAFYECYSLESVHLSSSLTSMGKCIFADCNSLSSLEIPSSFTKLWGENFIGCYNLTSIIIHSPIPPDAEEDAFSYGLDYNKCVLHVPAGSENAYRQAEVWKNFTHIVGDLSGISSVGADGIADGIKVYSEMSSIVMEGVPADQTVRIFNFAGKEIWHTRGVGERLCYDHVIPGVYIVYVGSEPYKIIVH